MNNVVNASRQENMRYKVCILAAGKSKRESINTNINPALLPLGDKSLLTRIIEQFPQGTEFVIAVGYQAKQIKEYVDLVHANKKITLCQVDTWTGPQSSTADSILVCKEHLQCPFIMTTANILVNEIVPPPDENWVGIAPLPHAVDTRDFSIAETSNNIVKKLYVKLNILDLMRICNDYKTILDNVIIGINGVKDFKYFWHNLEIVIKGNIDNDKKLSFGIEKLIDKQLVKVPFTYYDTGHDVGYEYANRMYDKNLVLRKGDEYIYFEKDLVIKYFNNSKIVSRRVKRAELLKEFVPKLCMNNNNFYAYKKIQGETLSEVVDNNLFRNMLEHYNKTLWKVKKTNSFEKIKFKDACLQFYKLKTEKRIKKFYNKAKIIDKEEEINGIKVPALSDLMKNINWSDLANGVPVLYHGDFQPENIIVNNNEYFLIDWRQDFAGILEFGDVYYDLAKMKHALIISGEIIRNNQFEVISNDNKITFKYLMKSNLNDYLKILNTFITNNGYCIAKVNTLTSLIYLNIAPLHHGPYDLLLYYLGKLKLFQQQQKTKE